MDLVEFVMSVEDAFGISIADEHAEALVTPGLLVDHITARVASDVDAPCLSQRAFYAIRRATVDALGVSHSTVRPTTRWPELVGAGRRSRRAWQVIGAALQGVSWPGLRPLGGVPAAATVGSTAAHLAVVSGHAFLRDGEGWTRPQVELVVRALMREQFGIEVFDWNDHFVLDLGLD